MRSWKQKKCIKMKEEKKIRLKNDSSHWKENKSWVYMSVFVHELECAAPWVCVAVH